MSVQLREPCTRSIRHLLKPLRPTLFNHRPTRFTLRLLQGNSNNTPPQQLFNSIIPPTPFKGFFLNTPKSRSYTTSAALRSISEDVSGEPAIIESSLSKVQPQKQQHRKGSSNKKNALRLWTQYQTNFAESKETLDIKQYDTLMTALVEKAATSKKTGFWIKAIQAYEESRTLDLKPSATMYMAALKAYGKTRDMGNVLAIWREYKKKYRPKSTSCHNYMTAVLNCGEMNTAHRIFSRDINSNPSITKMEASISLADFVSFCVKKNNLLLALKATESLSFYSSLDSWDKDALDKVTQSLWSGYHSILQANNSTPITPLSVETFVSMYIEKGKPTTTTDKLYIPSRLFTMFNLICHNNIITPTVNTCNLVLDIQALDHHFGRVKSILATMQRLDIEPSLETVSILVRTFGSEANQQMEDNVYNAFIKATSEQQQQEDSMRTMEQFKKRGEMETKAMDWLLSKNCMDLECYAMVFESYLEAGAFNQCIAEYERLKIDLPHIDTDRRIVKSLVTAKLADNNDSLDWNQQCESSLSNLKINFTPNTVIRILMTMINLTTKYGAPLVDGKQIFESLQLLESKLDIQLSADGISRLITSLGRRGDVENGYRIYRYVRGRSLDTNHNTRCSTLHIYRAMMSSATKNNDLRKLERAWVDMQYRNGIDKELHDDITTYNILLNGYASRLPRPDLTRAKRLFQRILKQPNLTPDRVTYNILIKAFVNANNMEAANQVFQKMIDSGTTPDNYTTNTILNGWIIQKDWTKVENFVSELISKKSDQFANLDIVTFNLLVQSFLQLDSKSMNYYHLLKNKHNWAHIEQLEQGQQQQQQQKKMSSEKIWTIFESTTGYTKSTLNAPKPPQQNQNAFVKLFSATEADEVTCKLFMKAFVNIGDNRSALKVLKWMNSRSSSD